MNCTTAKKKTLELVEAVGELLALRRLLQNCFRLLRKSEKFCDPLPPFAFRKRPANLRQIRREKKQDSHLRRERLSGRYADLRAGMSVENAIRFAGDG